MSKAMTKPTDEHVDEHQVANALNGGRLTQESAGHPKQEHCLLFYAEEPRQDLLKSTLLETNAELESRSGHG